MVVKILKAAAGFAGVGYSDNKIIKGTAELMKAENFVLSGGWGIRWSAGDYARLLAKHSQANRLVKKPQFHAVLSAKGKEHSKEELTEMAQQYLDKMGYGKNPYLIYFHGDTDNNHVHIVTSRVDGKGEKIDDAYERIRSQKAMKEILMQDVGEEIEAHVNKAMGYNFSTPVQFKMLLESQGVKLNEKDGEYQFIKYGQVQYSTGKAEVDDKIKEYAEPKERVKQLRAIINKYKPGLSNEAFAEFAREKFGLEMVMHQAEGKYKPYGFTVVDHAQKQVFKGSQLMEIGVFLSLPSQEERLSAAREIVGRVAKDDSLSFFDVKRDLQKLGYELGKKGHISLQGEEEVLFSIGNDKVKALLYNSRLAEARSFTLSGEKEAAVIASVFYLKKQDAERLLAMSHEKPGAIRTQAGKGEVVDRLRAGVTSGELLAHGAAPYNHDDNNNMSYYIRIKTAQGEKELWGVDLKRALEAGGAEIGQRIGIENLGQQAVSAVVKDFDEKGNVVGTKTVETHRNGWDVKPLVESHYLTTQSREKQRREAGDILSSMTANGWQLKDIVEENKWILAEKGGEIYLIDKKEKTIQAVSSLTSLKLDYSWVEVLNLNREHSREQGAQLDYSGGGVSEMAATLLDLIKQGSQGERERERKWRRGPKR
ncbi:hypothetical protein DXT99_25240 [Pontibacter diazotrophicus]|uniref:MobA/VirD2-like nuclease domain-containing protein n=1 Tax=Pontibacter diazotrophicus TaxID=1400979 RepID=A0A3D8L153_9BACT|nr:relaxase/mobilization nuclease domain-containing protein [Pontibacter diazotrophicus]RDV11121.1 hypothetical protein DXT99_25240 [Pontibacter diazotrophicus]